MSYSFYALSPVEQDVCIYSDVYKDWCGCRPGEAAYADFRAMSAAERLAEIKKLSQWAAEEEADKIKALHKWEAEHDAWLADMAAKEAAKAAEAEETKWDWADKWV